MNEKEKNKDEFVWTDELVILYANEFVGKTQAREFLEIFKKIWQRKPLFVTEDGVDVFEDGAELICVEKDFSTRKAYISPFASPIECNKYFSTEAAAKEYVRLNKPMYSLNDIKQASKLSLFVDKVADDIIRKLEKLKP